MIVHPRIDRGSKILVTGVNGLVASHVADQSLKARYKTVGTVRDARKAQWMKERFEKAYGEECFEIVTVADMAVEGALDEAVKGKIDSDSPLEWVSLLTWQGWQESLMLRRL